MFEQKRLGDNGTSAATSKESGDRGDEMDEKDGQVDVSDLIAVCAISRTRRPPASRPRLR
jgi:hypothetical protein